jgi:hypothetical protein
MVQTAVRVAQHLIGVVVAAVAQPQPAQTQ